MAAQRLQKILAQAGVASRRDSEKYITQGRVRVNGKVVNELGSRADPDVDTIEVDGFGTLKQEPHAYIALHKPIHVISSVKDPEGRQTVLDMIADTRAVGGRQFEGSLPRVYPVGRLDFDAEGLILLTNDGDLANKLMHPRHHVPKTYLAKVKGRPEDRQLERMARGVRLKENDGSLSRRTAPAEVRVFKEGKANCWLEITVIEGRNHQVKRMCEAIGAWVLRLIRIEFGGVSIDPLPAGAWRFLTAEEVSRLKNWPAGGKLSGTLGGKKTAPGKKGTKKTAKKKAAKKATKKTGKKATKKKAGKKTSKKTTKKAAKKAGTRKPAKKVAAKKRPAKKKARKSSTRRKKKAVKKKPFKGKTKRSSGSKGGRKPGGKRPAARKAKGKQRSTRR